MNVRYVPLGLAFVVFAGSLIACSGSSDSKPTDSTPAPTTGTTSENNTTSSTVDMKAVSYSKDVKPLFQKFCLPATTPKNPSTASTSPRPTVSRRAVATALISPTAVAKTAKSCTTSTATTATT